MFVLCDCGVAVAREEETGELQGDCVAICGCGV